MKQLINNSLFKGIPSENIAEILSNITYSVKKFNSGEIIATEADNCDYLGIIVSGTVQIKRIYLSGNYIVLKKLKAGEIFGEALIFLKNGKYPATVEATEKCEIIFISRKEIIKLCSKENIFLENFVSLLSNKLLMLNEKIKKISFKTVRQKVINYLLEQSKVQNSLEIILNETKEDIAASLGIPRPSFSRELINLKEEGLISYNRKKIKLLMIEEIEQILN